MNLKNLFPQDTRSAELISAAALFVFGIGMMIGQHDIQTVGLLGIVSILFGWIQFSSILAHPRLELSRVLFAWVNGTFWIWLTYSVFPSSLSEAALCAILGISNYAAFLINLNILRILWKP